MTIFDKVIKKDNKPPVALLKHLLKSKVISEQQLKNILKPYLKG